METHYWFIARNLTCQHHSTNYKSQFPNQTTPIHKHTQTHTHNFFHQSVYINRRWPELRRRIRPEKKISRGSSVRATATEQQQQRYSKKNCFFVESTSVGSYSDCLQRSVWIFVGFGSRFAVLATDLVHWTFTCHGVFVLRSRYIFVSNPRF